MTYETYDIVIKKALKEKETEIDTIIFDKLSQFPYELFTIPSLETLYLDEKLSEFEITSKDFDNLANLKKLKRLSLIGNDLKFIPKQIGELENLEELIIFGNEITTIPYEIIQCKKLKELHVSSNLIDEFPDFLLELENLEILCIGSNPLNKIPRRIDKLKKLKTLNIHGSKITNLPIELLNLDLEEFEINNTLIKVNMNDKEWMSIRNKDYTRRKLEYYFNEYKLQFKKKLKIWLANNEINKVFEALTSHIPEFSYYDTPKDVIIASSRYRHIQLERRRGTLSFENEKLELNKLVLSLIEIVEEF